MKKRSEHSGEELLMAWKAILLLWWKRPPGADRGMAEEQQFGFLVIVSIAASFAETIEAILEYWE